MKNTKLMYDHYFKLQKELEDKYGPKSVVYYMVGSFYEIYEYNFEGKKRQGRLTEVSQILNCSITRKNKKYAHSLNNPYMGGFPDHSLGKKIEPLLNAGYTISIYDQEKKQGKMFRTHTNTISSGTYIDNNYETSCVMCVDISKERLCYLNKDYRTSVNISTIDLSLGKVFIHQLNNHKQIVVNEIVNYVDTMNVKEIIFIDRNEHKLIDLFKKKYKHSKQIITKQLIKKYDDRIYQVEVLKKVYAIKKEPIQELDLHYYNDALPSLIQLLDYVYEHDPYIIQKLCNPEIKRDSKYLYINQDAFSELNVFKQKYKGGYNGDYNSLFNVINRTNTKMGERLLKRRLLYCITNIKELTKRYDEIEKFKTKYKQFKHILRHILDIEKKFRRFSLYKLPPLEFIQLEKSFESILSVLKLDNHTKLHDLFLTFVNDFSRVFYMDGLNSKPPRLFNIGIFPLIDKNIQLVKENRNSIYDIATQLSKQISKLTGKSCEYVKVDNGDKEGYYLKMSKTRWNKFKSKLKEFKIGGIRIQTKKLYTKSLKNDVKIFGDEINQFSDNIFKYIKIVEEMNLRQYKKITDEYMKKYSSTYQQVIQKISEIDLYCSCAEVSIKCGYTRPKFCKKGITIKGIRHPIIERIQDDEKYVQNDVYLNDKQKGIVLFGMNASGKSSLLRSIGTNVILAQMGMFVSATTFTFKPYTKLMTKISSNDDLFQGQSTFIKEMIELKHILKECDENSLVLCDELTSGTETFSAIGIVMATISQFITKNIPFLFTTHLHELANKRNLFQFDTIGIYHFRIIFNKNGTIKYERVLQKNSGDSMYGIEIASQLGLSKDFIKDAYKHRANFLQTHTNIVTNKRSRYNKKIIMDNCELCGTEYNLQTHHILHQKTADKEGMIGIYSKNAKHNLQKLCADCHKKQH